MTLIPAAGPIIMLVFECQDSVADNQYGPHPKAVFDYSYSNWPILLDVVSVK